MYKKIILVFVVILFPSLVLGASVSFPSQQVSYKAGQTFSFPVYISSTDADKVFTAKVALSYDSEYLEVTSFSFKEGSLSLAQPGYDKIDNVNGSLIKTAGYPSGVSTQTLFGTATFKAKKAGSTNISVSTNSQLLNKTNQNILTSRGGVAVTLGEIQKQAEITKQPTEEVAQKEITNEEKTTVVEENKVTPSFQVVEKPTLPNKMNPVFLASLSLFAGVSPIIWVVLALICMIGVFYLLRKKK